MFPLFLQAGKVNEEQFLSYRSTLLHLVPRYLVSVALFAMKLNLFLLCGLCLCSLFASQSLPFHMRRQ
jgi:hypothetical protein